MRPQVHMKCVNFVDFQPKLSPTLFKVQPSIAQSLASPTLEVCIVQALHSNVSCPFDSWLYIGSPDLCSMPVQWVDWNSDKYRLPKLLKRSDFQNHKNSHMHTIVPLRYWVTLKKDRTLSTFMQWMVAHSVRSQQSSQLIILHLMYTTKVLWLVIFMKWCKFTNNLLQTFIITYNVHYNNYFYH